VKFLKNLSTLSITLGVSVLVHAALLAVRFVDPERFDRIFQDTPLEVILVNAKSTERPEVAKAVAQASLAGGGEADKGRATTPLPPSAISEVGDAAEQAQRKVEAMQEQQTMLLTQIKQQLASMMQMTPQQAAESAEAMEQEEKRRQMMQLLAEIERRINEENARPKKRYISPATREEVYAVYYDSLRRKIEDKGTENFPNAAGRKLYGELTVVVTVNHDGKVLEVEVAQSSGNPLLDRRAQAIARESGPFGRFNQAMRRQADQIVVVSRFKFTRDEVLEATLTAPVNR
jgi:protein TonB